MNRKKLIIANWKAYITTAKEAKDLFAAAKRGAGRLKRVSVVVCPSFLHLALFSKVQTSACRLGAQDVSVFESGPRTGEVSAQALADAGAKFCIVGHSERLAMGETDEMTARKIKMLLNAGITPVVCIGEDERDEAGNFLKMLEDQIRSALAAVSRARASRLIIVYEPVWAINRSASDAMSPRDVHETILYLRKILSKLYGRRIAMSIPVLYGGSVEPGNAATLSIEGGVSGFLVGHASVDAKMFGEILRAVDAA